jgi:glucose/arabinose dehydrogenase
MTSQAARLRKPVSSCRDLAIIILLALVCVACGGGGGGGSGGASAIVPAPAPPAPVPGDPLFGLDVRPVVAAFNVPTQVGAPTGFALQNAFPNLSFSASIFLAGVPGQDRLVVVEQGGRIHAFTNDSAVSATRVVLDISPVVNFSGEQGLLGLAFDPDFISNGYIYLHYSVLSPRRSVISRFTWNAGTDLVTPASEKIILELDQPAGNHNGGMLAFGSDDYLYIAFGDGGGGGDTYDNGQNPLTLHGNILRIDVSPANPVDAYDIPSDNPFVGTAGFRDEIWALGLRNPFRFSFDRQNGDLWLGDVGQNEWEEVDLIERGGNYGWPRYEGDHPFNIGRALAPGTTARGPIAEYNHGSGRAIIGGYVYRGSEFAALFGRYLYSDNSSGTVWALDYDGASTHVIWGGQ